MMAFHRLHMAAPVYFSDCQQTVAPNSTGTCQASKGSLARLQVLVEGADFLGAEARWIFVKGFGHSFAGILCGRKGSRILIWFNCNFFLDLAVLSQVELTKLMDELAVASSEIAVKCQNVAPWHSIFQQSQMQ